MIDKIKNILSRFDRYTIVYALCFLVFLTKYFTHITFSDFYGVKLFFPGIDNTYWLYFLNGIPKFIANSYFISQLLDCVMVLLPLFLLVKRTWKIFNLFYTLLLINYFLFFNSVAFHHYHGLISLIILTIPFLFKKEETITILWDAARYYFLFAFSSAAIWKLSRGGVFNPEQMINILKSQHVELIIKNPGDYHISLLQFFIRNPYVAQFLLWMGLLIELVFCVGFFTKKYDLLLVTLFVSFLIFNLLIMNVDSHEFGLFIVLLFSYKKKNQST